MSSEPRPGDRPAALAATLGHTGPQESWLGPILVWFYGWTSHGSLRRIALNLALRLEGAHFFSVSARRILSRYHGVEIGLYTQGGCFKPGGFHTGTVIGRYCSIAATAVRFGRNHPMNLKSMHAFFFNERLAGGGRTIQERGQLTIGNDVWIGHNAVILPSVTSIGDGAVIGAGAVVNKNVPPYGVATGNPCRVVRYRFSEEMRERLLEERWWERPLEDALAELDTFQTPLEGDEVR